MKIYDFKIDSEIVRIKPSKYIGDRSYIGSKLIFRGIANGMIYLITTDKLHLSLFGKDKVELQLDDFYDDWEYYVDPPKLVRKEKLNRLEYVIKKFDISDDELNKFIKILQIGIIEQEKLEKIDSSLKNKLENWIQINKNESTN